MPAITTPGAAKSSPGISHVIAGSEVHNGGTKLVRRIGAATVSPPVVHKAYMPMLTPSFHRTAKLQILTPTMVVRGGFSPPPSGSPTDGQGWPRGKV